MQNMRRVVLVAAAFLVAFAVVSSAAWKADFTPSKYNPDVGEIINLAVCEPCLDGGAFHYRWDTNGDGVVDEETDDPVFATSFDAAGFYEVELTIVDDGGRKQTCRKGLLVGALPAYATREVLEQDDGTLFVVLTVEVAQNAAAIGLEEAIPQGWQLEVLDSGGATTRTNGETRKEEVLWMSAFEAGDELTFSYRLHPGYGTSVSRFSGEFSGYASGERFAGDICGELSLP
jgi:hypothetical protein